MNLFFAHRKSYQSEFTFAHAFIFLRSYFASVDSLLDKSAAKGTREEDLRKIVAQNREPEKSKDDSICELKCLCCH